MTVTFEDLAEVLTEATDPEGERIAVSPDDLEQLRRQYDLACRLEGLPVENANPEGCNQYKPCKVGDRVKVVSPRTSGGRAHEIVVEKLLPGGKARGKIRTGPLAGTEFSGRILDKGEQDA